MDKVHICLKSIFGDSWLGGSLYMQNLARAVASLPREEREDIRLSVVVRAKKGEGERVFGPFADTVYTDGLWKLALSEAAKQAARVSFMPRGLLNPRQYDFVYPEVAGARAPYMWGGWIPDFQYRYLPQMFTDKQRETFERVYSSVARNAPVVILSSKSAEQDFQRFYPHAASRSAVMTFVSPIDPEWLRPDPGEAQAKYGLPDRFFLVSNQFWKHKDHFTVIEAVGTLKERGIECVVACTGSVDEKDMPYFQTIRDKIDSLKLGKQVRILGFIPRVDQIQLMRRSLAVIQPSLFEGWSTVVEDARSLSKPVLLSDFPVHMEQDPPDAFYFPRGDYGKLADLMAKAWETYEPGPDPEREARAQTANGQRLVDYGRRFLSIVRRVLSR